MPPIWLGNWTTPAPSSATQGGGLGGVALGYYRAAPPGLQTGEPANPADGGITFPPTRCSMARRQHPRRALLAQTLFRAVGRRTPQAHPVANRVSATGPPAIHANTHVVPPFHLRSTSVSFAEVALP